MLSSRMRIARFDGRHQISVPGACFSPLDGDPQRNMEPGSQTGSDIIPLLERTWNQAIRQEVISYTPPVNRQTGVDKNIPFLQLHWHVTLLSSTISLVWPFCKSSEQRHCNRSNFSHFQWQNINNGTNQLINCFKPVLTSIHQ